MRFDSEEFSRRRFLTGLAAAGVMKPFSSPIRLQGQIAGDGLPVPSESGIDHVVLVMMENRSFDHFLGWLPGANGRQAGLRYPVTTPYNHYSLLRTIEDLFALDHLGFAGQTDANSFGLDVFVPVRSLLQKRPAVRGKFHKVSLKWSWKSALGPCYAQVEVMQV
jgi:phospholipase C